MTDSLLATLWRASWQGAVVIALVYVFCRLIERRVSASLRCAIWRLTYLKLLAGLIVAGGISLPLLRVARVTPVPDSPVYFVNASLPAPNSQTNSASSTPAMTLSETASPEQPISRGALVPPANATGVGLSWKFAALALYGAGVTLLTARLLLAALRTWRILETAAPEEDPEKQAMFARLALDYGLARAPRLARSAVISSPAYFPGVVALPMGAIYAPDELRLVFAHELAHARRRDLVFDWLGIAAQTLFFFHPLVWLARHEERLARETAADALALQITAAAPAAMGALLVELATAQAGLRPPTVALGVFETGGGLRRRLRALSAVQRRSSFWATTALLALVALTLLPYRVTSARSHEKAVPPPGPRVIVFQPRSIPMGDLQVSGTVHADNGDPVHDVSITASMPRQQDSVTHANYSMTTVPDQNGRYTLTNLPPGRYSVNVNSFNNDQFHLRDYATCFAEFTLAPHTPPKTLDLLAPQGVLVSGRLTDHTTGKPLVHVRVTGGIVADGGWDEQGRDLTLTDADGLYRVRLPAGEVFVSPYGDWPKYPEGMFRMDGKSGESLTCNMSVDARVDRQWPDDIVNDVTELAPKQPQRDYRDPAFPHGSVFIEGRVTDVEKNRGAANVEVWIKTKSSFAGRPRSLMVHTESTGLYRADDLAPGKYQVSINLNQIKDVTLDAISGETVDLRYLRPVTITGRVVNAATGAPEPSLYVQGAHYHSQSGDWTETAVTDANGRYSLELQPGELFLTPYPNWDRSLPETGKRITVSPGQIATLDFAVDDRKAHEPVRLAGEEAKQ